MPTPTLLSLSAATLCPALPRWLSGDMPDKLVCHCWFVECGDRRALIDTGFGLRALSNPSMMGRLVGASPKTLRPLATQLASRGVDPTSLTDIIVTHLDFDHAGGLEDFPNATIHVWHSELSRAKAPPLREKARYRTKRIQAIDRWQPHQETSGEAWHGFDVVRELAGFEGDVLLVPLPGHSVGHLGIAVRQDAGWRLHAGDAYMDQRELSAPAEASRMLRRFGTTVHDDRGLAAMNLDRLRTLSADVDIVCSHDASTCPGCLSA
ncbi:MAG: glyoxylase-like metal-dependent hydrolase (beta-lactamase superfamily II) [Bradymonadia bacterium]|jgi:glyoxylase-like metal-dependent hydrolase (beta-lactamase superfamily II)